MAHPLSLPVWSFRAVWLVSPLLQGTALADALSDTSRPVQMVVSIAAWAAWAGVLIASAVPRTATLTTVRLVAPGSAAVSIWAALASEATVWGVVGVAVAVVAVALALTPGLADHFVDGSSYGPERRVALRLPPALLVPVALAWVVVAAAVAGPALALATEAWVLGGVAAVAGAAVAALLVVRLHQLSRRWLVFVPAGMVVHDPLALAQPVLLQRHLLRRVGPAPADAGDRGGDHDDRVVDLTGGALGLALELRATEAFSLGRRRGREAVETTDIDAVLVTPGRPAAALEIAAEHRLPVS